MSDSSWIGTEPFVVGEGLETLVFSNIKSFDRESFPDQRFSWIGKPQLARVSDQRPHRTCLAHSLARAHETLRRQKGLGDVRFDADQFHQCVLGLNCSAGAIDVIGSITRYYEDGAPAEPNLFEPGAVCPNPPLPRISCSGAMQIADEQTAKQAVQGYRPIVALMSCEPRFSEVSDFGIYRDTDGPKIMHHALMIVGFDEVNQCWEVQNSTGTDWGENGFGRIAYGHASLFADAGHPGFLLY